MAQPVALVSPVPEASKSMLQVLPAEEADYGAAFSLMRENMDLYYETHRIPWDQEWLESNYRDKENYSLHRKGEWIGFLSLEWLPQLVYIHTLQLAGPYQGSIFGIRVFEWLLEQATGRNIKQINCRTFRDHPALNLYKKLGFEVSGEDGPLVELHLSF